MFKETRIKLTAWYLLIIMSISIFFSAVIYEGFSSELGRVERIQRLRIERQFPGMPNMVQQFGQGIEAGNFYLDPDLINETKQRLILILVGINSFILVSSAVAGYFLAGRTLQPIKLTLEEQKRFTADASHELRTPLTSMKTEIEVFLRGKRLSLDEARKLLKSNLEEVNKMQKLSNYLLTLNKYQDRSSFPLKEINLKEIAKEGIHEMEKSAKMKNIKIIQKLKSTNVYGNKDSLVKLMTILLDNAIKYSKKGRKIIVKTESNFLEVEDFGIGIAKKDISHIFDRFYRAETSRSKEKVDGYGLGLSIAKNIVELHKAKIEVKSKLGKGAAFIVRF
jgi:two-component system sensor histidine kinase CiaH